MDEWKRFANAAVQEELIARAEALRAKYPFDKPEELKPDDLDAAAKELHEIQERWKLAADAPRAQAQALWHRYRQAADPVQAHVREFFAERAGERKRQPAAEDGADRARRGAGRVHRLGEDRRGVQEDPGRMAGRRRRCRAPETRMTWKRFREACDKFFTRRNADLASARKPGRRTSRSKEALIARAEELQMSTDWEKTAAEIRRLQADWKASGPVRRNKSEVVWQRFRTACDTFFERYKRRDQIELEGKQADREAIVAEVEALAAEPPAENRQPSSSVCARSGRSGISRRRWSARVRIR